MYKCKVKTCQPERNLVNRINMSTRRRLEQELLNKIAEFLATRYRLKYIPFEYTALFFLQYLAFNRNNMYTCEVVTADTVYCFLMHYQWGLLL